MKSDKMRQSKKSSYHKSKQIKFLVLMSVLLPLIILSSVLISQEKQDIAKFFRQNQSSLSSEIQKAIFALQNLIQANKIQLKLSSSLQLSVNKQQNRRQNKKQQAFIKAINNFKQSKAKYFKLSDNLSDQKLLESQYIQISRIDQLEQIKQIQKLNAKTRQKNWFEVVDKIVLSVNLMGVDQFSPPLSSKTISQLKQILTNHMTENSFLGPFLQKDNVFGDPFFTSGIQISIKVKSSHISEIEQNNRKKLQSIFNSQKSLISEQFEQNQLNLDEFYIQQILKEIEQTNKGQECLYERNHIECKEFHLVVLYQDLQIIEKLNSIYESESEPESISEDFDGQKQKDIDNNIIERLNQLHYWTRQDKSISLVSFHPFKQKNASHSNLVTMHQNNQQMLYSLLTQLIYQHLSLSPFLLLTKDKWLDLTQEQKSLQIQVLIEKFIQLNQFYKLQQSLQHMNRILENKDIIYERISDDTRNKITKLLDKVHLCASNESKCKLSVSNSITVDIINNLNSFDPFPFDYKLGALIPIAIILFYPLIGFLKLLFK